MRALARRTGIGFFTAALVIVSAASAGAKTPIELENAKPVVPSKDDWLPPLDPATGKPTTLGINGTVDAYPSSWSVKNGDVLGLRVSTTAASFRTRIYRIGWYANSPSGSAVGSRLVLEVPGTPGERQAFPAENTATGIAECGWKDSVTVTIPADWVTGHYVARFTTSEGAEAFTYFVVRDDAAPTRAPLLYVDSLATNAAYNPWPMSFDSSGRQVGGKSAHPYNSAGRDVEASGEQVAVEVSLDRPQAENWGLGIWLDYTLPTVQWLEQRGYDVAYADSLDLDAGAVLSGRRMWMDSGHDEYWSMPMWDNVQAARDAGVNLAFFSGNDFTWQVRFAPGRGGARSTMVAYKDASYPNAAVCGTCVAWGGDPEFQLALAAKKAGKLAEQVSHLKLVTYAWLHITDFDPSTQKPIAAPSPVARNPIALEGLKIGPRTPDCTPASKPDDTCFGIDWVVDDDTHWIYTGFGVPGGVLTGLGKGDAIPHIVGYEMDSAFTTRTFAERPKGQVILAHTDTKPFVGGFNAQYYEAPSGARVFSAGTINWSWGLDRKDRGPWGTWDSAGHVKSATSTITIAQAVTGITVNVLNKGLEEPPRAAPDAGPGDATVGDGGPRDGGANRDDSSAPLYAGGPPRSGGCSCRTGLSPAAGDAGVGAFGLLGGSWLLARRRRRLAAVRAR